VNGASWILVDNLPHKLSFPWSICHPPLWRVSTWNRPWCILVGSNVGAQGQQPVAPGRHPNCPPRGQYLRAQYWRDKRGRYR